MDYQTLDNIADSYIPMLAIIAFFASIFVPSGFHSRIKITIYRLGCVCTLLSVAYGFMFLDNTYAIWPNLGLDYSTHTAVSSVLVLFLILLIPLLSVLWITSLVVYYILMIYQQYHTISDIISTDIVLFSVIAFIVFIVNYIKPGSPSNSDKMAYILPFMRKI
jgi:hypothetical protein